MPDRPLLPLPGPVLERRAAGNPPRESVRPPGRGRQGARLGPRFDRLAAALGDPAQLAALQSDPNSIAPDRAIVFEVASTLSDFYAAAANIPGLELLAEAEIEAMADADFVTVERERERPDRSVSERLYFAMPDVAALRELVRLWRHWQQHDALPYGFGKWKPIFERLRDMRPWGPQDRLPDDVIAIWREQLGTAPEASQRVELELWYLDGTARRSAARESVRGQVAEAGGRVVHEADIEEIRYTALLAELPAAVIQRMIDDRTVSLARIDGLMFIRPQSVAAVIPPEDDDGVGLSVADQTRGTGPLAADAPLAALLDGLPLAGHALLAGRLTIEDPDVLSSRYGNAAEQVHGTEMASLIVHGDLQENGAPLPRPLYVRPVLHGNGIGRSEVFPSDRLLLDTIYRCVRRLFEGEAGEAPTAPSVRILNLSLGDALRPFAGIMSPWARLIDWLAYRYRLLVIVSAGNILDDLDIAGAQSWGALETTDARARTGTVLQAVNATRAQRSLLAPAEAINALTIGAGHWESGPAGPVTGMQLDPYDGLELPNVSSGLGLGYRRGVKPELLFAGGRERLALRQSQNPVRARLPAVAHGFGVEAACPDRTGRLDRTRRTFGTSPAAALATRAAHRVIDTLLDIGGGSLHGETPLLDLGLMAKVLLVHGAAWDPAAAVLVQQIADPAGNASWQHQDDDVARFLGFGRCDVERVIACAANRAIIVGSGSIRRDQAAVFRLPLPPSLENIAEWRAVTTTLAWLTPVSPRHRFYRDAQLRIEPGGSADLGAGVERSRRTVPQPTKDAAHRGTVFHERRAGEAGVGFADNGDIVLRISCSSPTDALEADDEVPFALAVSIETGPASAISVYNEVRTAVLARVRAQVQPQAR